MLSLSTEQLLQISVITDTTIVFYLFQSFQGHVSEFQMKLQLGLYKGLITS